MANIGSPAGVLEMGEVQATARTLGIEVSPLGLRRSEDIAPAFEEVKGRAEALYICGDALITNNRTQIISSALGARLATMCPSREHVDAGGLMSYGPNFPHLHGRAADYVDKILHGVKAGDIPVEQPTKFEFVINLKTAKTLSLDAQTPVMTRGALEFRRDCNTSRG